MDDIVLRCHRGLGPVAVGHALVADDDFSARYDLDRIRGVFSRPSHRLFGESYVNRVLVLNTAKGGVASAWMLRDMAERGMAPCAFVFNSVNPILAQGAAFADLTMVDHFCEGDVTEMIRTGDRLRVDAAAGEVTILRRSPAPAAGSPERNGGADVSVAPSPPRSGAP